jgi:hypothetical protein
MSSGIRVTYVSLLFAATTLGAALPTPAAAQRVEVFVNGQRVTDIVINGRVNGVRNGAVNGFHNGRVNGFRNGAVNGFSNGRVNGFRNGAVNGFRNGAVNGARNGFNGANGRRVFINGANGRRVVRNGFNGANGRVRAIPAEGNIGAGVRWGLHNKTHVGSYDVCRFDPVAGMGICSRSRTGLHTGRHRGLFAFPRRDFTGM